jgi:hypothetical protein
LFTLFEFVIILVVAVLAFRLWETKLKYRNDPIEEEQDEKLRIQLSELQDRVEVLERIVTDPRYDLNRQLKDLEDDPRNTA